MRLPVLLFTIVFLVAIQLLPAQSTKLYYVVQEGGRPLEYDRDALYISSFPQFKADFRRLCGISLTQNGQGKWIAACTEKPFEAADIGKVLVIKSARSYPQYRKAPFTLNTIITAVNAGEAEIESFDGSGTNNTTAGVPASVTGQCGFVATDNFDVLQRAIDSCAAKGKPRLVMDYDGTAYLVPQRSSRTMPRSYQKMLVVNSGLELRGYDSSRTKMKWGMEDISRVDESQMPYYTGFWVRNCTFILKKMTLLGPDRGSTNTDHQLIEALHGDEDNNIGQSLFVDSSAIVSEDGNGFEGWGSALYMQNSQIPDIDNHPTDTAFQSVTNSFITAQGGSNYFAKNANRLGADIRIDTLNRVQRIQNTSIKGGARYVLKANGVSIQPGSDTIVVHDPQFSFYNLTDYERNRTNFRQPWICVPRFPYSSSSQQGDTNTVYWTQVNRVLNDSTAVMDTAARAGQFYIINGLVTTTTGSAIVTGNTGAAGTNFLFELYPGDELYSNDIGNSIYIGTVLSIQSNNQLTLTADAVITASNIQVKTPATALYFPPNYPFFNYNYTTYRLHGVRWPVSNGTLYTKRAGGNDAAFHSLYISGNVGTDNSNCYFQPLRQSRRCAADCGFPFTLCGACLVRDINITKHDDQNWYPAAGELKIFQQGPGFGFAVSSAQNYETPPAKP